jgi:hypothetical protein
MKRQCGFVFFTLVVGVIVVSQLVRADGELRVSPPNSKQAGLGANLKNAGFESGTDGWSIHVYGAKPAIETDADVKHEGKQALRISSTQPSDTALGQELMLRPGHLYRFRGWVRTRGLDPKGSPAYGSFQIQTSGGSSIIAGGTNHKGDTDWTEVKIDFEAPPGGRTRVSVFFVGFGKGTGTAWFVDLKLEEIDTAKEPIRGRSIRSSTVSSSSTSATSSPACGRRSSTTAASRG